MVVVGSLGRPATTERVTVSLTVFRGQLSRVGWGGVKSQNAHA